MAIAAPPTMPRSIVLRLSLFFMAVIPSPPMSLGLAREPESRARRDGFEERFHAMTRGAEIVRERVDRGPLLFRRLERRRVRVELAHETRRQFVIVVDRLRKRARIREIRSVELARWID